MSALRTAAGWSAVFVLKGLAGLPLRITIALGDAVIPAYAALRTKTRKRLRTLADSGIRLSPLAYYRMRLRLAVISLRHHTSRSDGCTHKTEGESLYAAALASGRPIVLLGWHQGPVELLHKIPSEHGQRLDQGGRRTVTLMTASAFSPVLAEWMAAGRSAAGTRVIRPSDAFGLRAWARSGGVLAVMVDQVRGTPDAWLSLRGHAIALPWPRRLMMWVLDSNPVVLAVSCQWQAGNTIVFRYEHIPTHTTSGPRIHANAPDDAVKLGLTASIERALTRAPDQYNWSYGKIKVGPGTGHEPALRHSG